MAIIAKIMFVSLMIHVLEWNVFPDSLVLMENALINAQPWNALDNVKMGNAIIHPTDALIIPVPLTINVTKIISVSILMDAQLNLVQLDINAKTISAKR